MENSKRYEKWRQGTAKVRKLIPGWGKVKERAPKWAKGHQKWAKREPKGTKRELKVSKIRPRAVCGPPQGRVEIGSQSACNLPACTLSLPAGFLSAGFLSSRKVFAICLFFSRRIPSWIPPFPPCRSFFGHLLATVRTLLVESGLSCFRYVFLGLFLDDFWRVFD